MRIESLPPSYTQVDFKKDLKAVEDRAYWFQQKRIEGWLLKDTRYVVDKGDSIFGLAALVFIGIETLSCFVYGDEQNDTNSIKHPSKRFPAFLEEYMDSSFRTVRRCTVDFKDGRPPVKNPKDSIIFYRGLRNSLMHSFSFRRAELRMPMEEFKRWEPSKKILKIDARRLLIKFEDSVHRYMRALWKSKPGDYIYKNFNEMFDRNFVN